MASTGHYQRWQEDFELAALIGASHLRYGPPLHLIFAGPGHYDWGPVDEPMAHLRDHGPEPIVDLCHFGVPTWLGDFQNKELHRALAEYAGAFAARYPWVRFYTPVNEMYVCARMSALDGVWNEQLRDEKAFAAAAFNLARASIAMTDAILAVRPDAIFVNSESSEFCQPCCPDPDIQRIAQFENERRFLPLDLIYGHSLSKGMRTHLRDHGNEDRDMTVMAREVPRRSIIGVDYYEWNEKLIDSDGRPRALGELFGWYVIASQYYDRYKRPMMHTETNRMDASDGPRWLWRQWHNLQLLRSTGVPLVGFTWYSLTDQIDWEIALGKAIGNVDPVGLFDLNRDVRTVGLTYKRLIDMHRDQPGYGFLPGARKDHGAMSGFLSAHGYEPGPTQRPLLAGAISGTLATAPALALLHRAWARLRSKRASRPARLPQRSLAGWLLMAFAGALYARLLGRAANDPRGGWLLGMAFGFALWAAGAVFILPIAGDGQLPAGAAATGVFLSLVLWGGGLGGVLPFIHRLLHRRLDDAGIAADLGSAAAAPGPLAAPLVCSCSGEHAVRVDMTSRMHFHDAPDNQHRLIADTAVQHRSIGNRQE